MGAYGHKIVPLKDAVQYQMILGSCEKGITGKVGRRCSADPEFECSYYVRHPKRKKKVTRFAQTFCRLHAEEFAVANDIPLPGSTLPPPAKRESEIYRVPVVNPFRKAARPRPELRKTPAQRLKRVIAVRLTEREYEALMAEAGAEYRDLASHCRYLIMTHPKRSKYRP